MRRAEFGGQLHLEVGLDHPDYATCRGTGALSRAPSTRSTIRSAPSRTPTDTIRAAMSAISARLRSRAGNSDWTYSGVNDSSVTRIAPPAFTASCELYACSPLPAA